jgi:hypothetical protein
MPLISLDKLGIGVVWTGIVRRDCESSRAEREKVLDRSAGELESELDWVILGVV